MFVPVCAVPVLLCTLLAALYVASLYVWRSRLPRDHPHTVRRRFVSVLLVGVIAPLFPLCYRRYMYGTLEPSIWHVLGVRWDGLVPSLAVSYLLTAVLFLGPLVQQYSDGHWRLYLQPMYWRAGLSDLIWLRNHVVAPLSEEFTFRACMVPLLVTCFDADTVCLIVPLFFGVAHLHHLVERLWQGHSLLTALAVSCFQFAYTTLFGCYSAYLFVRTGHLSAPFIAHAFCNHMGFPDIAGLCSESRGRLLLVVAYSAGLLLWSLLLVPLTQPSLYGNTVYFNT